MPNRIIKESICTSDEINSLKPDEEILFYRLLVNCDDYGRFDARPAIIRAKCFSLRIDKIKDKDIDIWLKSLTKSKLIILYKVNDKPYLQLITWEKHQQIRAHKSKFPGLDDENAVLISDDINCNQLKSNVPVIQSNPIQSESNPKRKYGDFVLMTEEEYEKLILKYGEADTRRMVEKLDNYLGSKGTKYKSHYRAILSWVADEIKKNKPKENYLTNKTKGKDLNYLFFNNKDLEDKFEEVM